MSPEFAPFPKIARLNRDVIITEKLDGTNAAVIIVVAPFGSGTYPDLNRIAIITDDTAPLDDEGYPAFEYHVYAQSRNKFITPGKSTDNYGFAAWVRQNAQGLVDTLGAGNHYGEWWGSGIQRGYGLPKDERRFSLFNADRWAHTPAGFDKIDHTTVPGLTVVPVLYRGPYSNRSIHRSLELLASLGSYAARGFMRPEGIVIWHTAARTSFKVTIENDAAPAKNYRRNPNDLLPSENECAA